MGKCDRHSYIPPVRWAWRRMEKEKTVLVQKFVLSTHLPPAKVGKHTGYFCHDKHIHWKQVTCQVVFQMTLSQPFLESTFVLTETYLRNFQA